MGFLWWGNGTRWGGGAIFANGKDKATPCVPSIPGLDVVCKESNGKVSRGSSSGNSVRKPTIGNAVKVGHTCTVYTIPEHTTDTTLLRLIHSRSVHVKREEG